MASSIEYLGWGSGPWSRGSWGNDLNTLFVDGVEGTGAVGTVDTGSISFDVSGVACTGRIGHVAVGTAADATGVVGTGAVGDIFVDLNGIRVFASGVSATGYVATLRIWGDVVDAQSPSWQNPGAPADPSWTDVVDTETADWH